MGGVGRRRQGVARGHRAARLHGPLPEQLLHDHGAGLPGPDGLRYRASDYLRGRRGRRPLLSAVRRRVLPRLRRPLFGEHAVPRVHHDGAADRRHVHAGQVPGAGHQAMAAEVLRPRVRGRPRDRAELRPRPRGRSGQETDPGRARCFHLPRTVLAQRHQDGGAAQPARLPHGAVHGLPLGHDQQRRLRPLPVHGRHRRHQADPAGNVAKGGINREGRAPADGRQPGAQERAVEHHPRQHHLHQHGRRQEGLLAALRGERRMAQPAGRRHQGRRGAHPALPVRRPVHGDQPHGWRPAAQRTRTDQARPRAPAGVGPGG